MRKTRTDAREEGCVIAECQAGQEAVAVLGAWSGGQCNAVVCAQRHIALIGTIPCRACVGDGVKW